MSYHFNRWVITLGAQVGALHETISSRDSESIRRDARTYEAELQQLYTYAEQQNINLVAYYHAFSEIENRLLLINEQIELRQTVNSE